MKNDFIGGLNMYGLNKKQTKRMHTVMKFNEKNPDKYCWPDLYDMAVCEDREQRIDIRDNAKERFFCKKDVERNGSCWCGKFTSGGE